MSEEVKAIDINAVEVHELPSVLSSQFDKLAILETNVQKSVNMALEAKNKAEGAQVKIGLFDYSQKDAIKLIQSASKGLAEGLMTAAEAQKVSFEYQTKLAEITKFLFGLGVSNLAMNRSVVKELELKLKGATEEEISDLARQELKNVIMQLKAHEDMMKKQTELTVKVKKHQDQLESIDRQLDDIEQKTQDNIKNLEESLIRQGQALSDKNNTLDKKHSDMTKGLKEELSNLTNRINEDSKVSKENVSSLAGRVNAQILEVKDDLSKAEIDLLDKINSLEEKLINTIVELKEEALKKDKEVENKLADLKDRIYNLDVITSKLGWKIGISVVVAGSLILNILQICGIL
jgi:hypothetical protein